MSATSIEPSVTRSRILIALREAYLRSGSEPAEARSFSCAHEALLHGLDQTLTLAARLHHLALAGRSGRSDPR